MLRRATRTGVVAARHRAAASRFQREPQLLSCFSTAAVTSNNNNVPFAKHGKYPHLFEPLDLGPDIGILPNRALMGSMHSGLEGHSMPQWMVPWIHPEQQHKKNKDGSTVGESRWEKISAYMESRARGDIVGVPSLAPDQPEGHSESLDRMAAYFEARARGGVGLMVTGGIAPNMQGWAGPFSAQLTTQDEMKRHEVVTEAVHSVLIPVVGSTEGVPARICLQILHTGRYAYHPFCVSASATQSPISPFKARALSSSGIRHTIRDFVHTAALAQNAGYDGVEIMGSEGYLISQFLCLRTNHRTDEYGGTLHNRARLALEIIRQTRDAVGPSFIIIFRLSLLDLVEKGLLFEEALELASLVEQAGATIINTGIGWHEARVPTIATSVPRASFAFPTKRLKESGVVSIPIVATNRINHPKTAETLLASGSCDMISMARPFLADPELILKSRTGREDEINTCIGCNQACLDHVFVGKVASCLVNPAACHETEIRPALLPRERRLKLGVVGAGPAGCAFSIAARKMGHDVVLFDAADTIGGQFQMAKRIPGKEEFHETLRYLDTQLKKHKVDVRLGTKLSVQNMAEMQDIDKWVDATGVVPRDPGIPGQDHPNVLTYIDVLRHKKPVGKRVAIIGAGGIGFDVAEYLIHWDGTDRTSDDVDAQSFYKQWGIDETLQAPGGLVAPAAAADTSHDGNKQHRQLYLLQRKKSKLGQGLGKTTGWIHRATLKHSGAVEMLAGCKYTQIDENGHLHVIVDGSKRVLEVDNIILCAGQVEHTTLRDQAPDDLKGFIFAIGGAYHAGELDAKRAMDMGTRLALRIHDRDVVPGNHVQTPQKGIEETLFSYLRKFV